LHANGAIVVFHDDDPRVLKEIKSYLEQNGYEIWSKWVVINALP
jgi:DNA-binding response OmpR family regulator